MCPAHGRTQPETAPPGEPQFVLESFYWNSYLESKGYQPRDLLRLPEEQARKLRVEASMYASTRLAEVETRSRLVSELHGLTP